MFNLFLTRLCGGFLVLILIGMITPESHAAWSRKYSPRFQKKQEKEWSFQFGKKRSLGAYGSLYLSNQGFFAKSVGMTQLNLGAYLFGMDLPLTRISADYRAQKGKVIASKFSYDLLGFEVLRGVPSKDAVKRKKFSYQIFNKAFSRWFLINFIPIKVSIGARGESFLTAEMADGFFSTAIQVQPMLKTSTYLEIATSNRLEITGAGAEGSVSLLNGSIKLRNETGAGVDQLANPYLYVDFSCNGQLRALEGNLRIYAYTPLPDPIRMQMSRADYELTLWESEGKLFQGDFINYKAKASASGATVTENFEDK